jgi:seryl-tRNA synthetase
MGLAQLLHFVAPCRCYTFILPPHMLNEQSGFTAGQFPKFKNEVFWVSGTQPAKFMLPTAETALVNLYRDEILSIDDLRRNSSLIPRATAMRA